MNLILAVNTSPTIKKLIAFVLLSVLVFSFTPKQWLHDLVASHKDSNPVYVDGKIIVSTAGFHCQCDSPVVQSPFLCYDGTPELVPPTLPGINQPETVTGIVSVFHFFCGLRGPPATC